MAPAGQVYLNRHRISRESQYGAGWTGDRILRLLLTHGCFSSTGSSPSSVVILEPLAGPRPFLGGSASGRQSSSLRSSLAGPTADRRTRCLRSSLSATTFGLHRPRRLRSSAAGPAPCRRNCRLRFSLSGATSSRHRVPFLHPSYWETASGFFSDGFRNDFQSL